MHKEVGEGRTCQVEECEPKECESGAPQVVCDHPLHHDDGHTCISTYAWLDVHGWMCIARGVRSEDGSSDGAGHGISSVYMRE